MVTNANQTYCDHFTIYKKNLIIMLYTRTLLYVSSTSIKKMYKGFYQNRLATLHYSKEHYTGTGLCLRAFSNTNTSFSYDYSQTKWPELYFTASFAWSLALRLSSLQSNVNISMPLQGLGFLRVNVLLTCSLHISSL